MHCAKCGNKILKEWKFCKHCGESLTPQNFTETSKESSFSFQPIMFGLLAIIGTIIGIALLGIWIDFQIHTLSFWIIIPIGGFIVGAMGAFGYFYGLIKSNQKIKLPHYFVGAIVGLLTYIGIFYFLYSITYLDENNEVNYSFEGDHISNFVTTDSEEPISFLNYI